MVLAGLMMIGHLTCADAKPIRVNAKDGSSIQAGIDKLPAEGGTIDVTAKGVISVSESIVIARDNVTIDFHGATLRLADGVNAPVIIIGQDAAVPTVTHKNIHVRNVTIDGNRLNQTTELNPANPTLRNNGISLRRVESCSVANATVYSCRSGGLVSELGCRRLTVSQFEAYDNHFDGLAGYETEDSILKCLFLHDNLAAGFSFDIDFVRNLISDVVIADSGSVGIFMRDARDNSFTNLQIRDSVEHGIFLAQVQGDNATPASGNSFSACVISNSGGAALRVNDATCVDNVLVGSQLANNTGGGVSEVVGGLVTVSATLTR